MYCRLTLVLLTLKSPTGLSIGINTLLSKFVTLNGVERLNDRQRAWSLRQLIFLWGLHNLVKNWSWARDVNGRDWDGAEALTVFVETRQRQDIGTSWDRDGDHNRGMRQCHHSLLDQQHSALSFCLAWWTIQIISHRQLCIASVLLHCALLTGCHSHDKSGGSTYMRVENFGHFSASKSVSTYMRIALYAGIYGFYSASALLAMQSAVLARGILSVRPSFRHVPVLCPDEWRYDRAVCSIW